MTMPNVPSAPDPASPATPSPTPPTGNSTSATPPAPPEPWKAGADAPEWARGKTADEVLNLGKAMYGVLEKFNQQNVPQQQTQVPQQQGFGDIPDDDFISGKQAKELLRQMAGQFNQPNPALLNMAAQSTLAVIQQKYSKEFSKYGPEIQTMLTRVPKEAWNLDNLEQVVNIVRSNHIDDIAHERAERMIAEMGPTMRSTGGAGSNPVSQQNNDFTLNSEKLDQGWRDRAAKAGLTESQVDSYCLKNDMTRQDFYKQFEGKLLSDAVVNLGR